MTLKLLSLFSGIGAFEKALKNVGINYKLVNFCEIDKYASAAYCAVHQEPAGKNLHDITAVNVNAIPFVDLITYGFPCQDISQAGKQRGFKDEEGNLTRSGLFFKAADVIQHCRPRIAIAENVEALTFKTFKNEFKTVLDTLKNMGYKNYWQVLNAKDYGMPQNRKRVFIVSIREDIDQDFKFPAKVPLQTTVADFLNPEEMQNKGCKSSIVAFNESSGMFEVLQKTKKGFIECKPGGVCSLAFPKSQNRRGRVQANGDICPTLTAAGVGVCRLKRIEGQNHFEPLSELEMWRLMGFSDEDYQIAKDSGASNRALKTMAGNSIVVPVLEQLFQSLKNAGYL